MDIKQIFLPPVFENEEKNRIARLLNVILWAVVLFVGGLLLFELVAGTTDLTGRTLFANTVIVLAALGMLVIVRRGYVNATSIGLIAVSWVNLTYQTSFAGGIRDSSFIAFIIVILLANLLLGWQAGVVVAALSIATGWFLAYAEINGIIPTDIDHAYEISVEMTIIYGLITLILALTTAGLGNALRRARRSELSLTQSNRELHALSTSLEEQVTVRTRRLEVIAAVNERLSGILHLDELVTEVVNQVKENFEYYHAHIYLLNDQRDELVVAAGTGEAGAAMKAGGHSIALDAPTSLVARAARTGQIGTVDNVRLADDWLPNPLLPDTYAEMAVPIVLGAGGSVVGVLDVQEDEIGGLDEGDASLLRSLANQVAVAIRNASLFGEVETALAEAQAAQERYLEQSWQQTGLASASRGGRYHYAQSDAPHLDEATLTNARGLALTHPGPAVVTTIGSGPELEETQAAEESKIQYPKSIVAPIKLRNTAIGALQLHPLRADQTWTEDDLAVVKAIVDELAQTAEGLRLFEETRERASYESLVGEITDKLRQAPTLDSLAKTAAEALGNALGVSHSLIKVGVTPPPKNSAQNGEKG